MNNLTIENMWTKVSKVEQERINQYLKEISEEESFDNVKVFLAKNDQKSTQEFREKLLFLMKFETQKMKNKHKLAKKTYDMFYATLIQLCHDHPVNPDKDYYAYDMETMGANITKREHRVFTSTGHYYEVKDIVENINKEGREFREPKTNQPLSARDLKQVKEAAEKHNLKLIPKVNNLLYGKKPTFFRLFKKRLAITVPSGIAVGATTIVTLNPLVVLIGEAAGIVFGFFSALIWAGVEQHKIKKASRKAEMSLILNNKEYLVHDNLYDFKIQNLRGKLPHFSWKSTPSPWDSTRKIFNGTHPTLGLVHNRSKINSLNLDAFDELHKKMKPVEAKVELIEDNNVQPSLGNIKKR